MSIVKHLVDSRKSTLLEIPLINPAVILQEFYNANPNSELKPESKENKENFNLVECPYLIQAAIGGSWEIFKYFLDNSNINITGHIGLSKKKRNSIISNVFGAACFYGNIEMVKNLLINHINGN